MDFLKNLPHMVYQRLGQREGGAGGRHTYMHAENEKEKGLLELPLIRELTF